MNALELAQHQEEGAAVYVFSLYDSCRRRFLRSMGLVAMSTDAVPQLLTVGVTERVDLTPLLGPWRVIGERYANELRLRRGPQDAPRDIQVPLAPSGSRRLIPFAATVLRSLALLR